MFLSKYLQILKAKLIQLGLIISLALFFCFLSGNNSCFAMSGRAPIVSAQAVTTGKVTESGSTKVLVGAEVTIYTPAGRSLGRALTNSSGTYSISIPNKGYFLIRCYLQGYASQVTMKQLTPGKTYTQNFALKKIENKPPVINATNPVNAAEFLAGAKLILEVKAYDPNAGDTLQYQFSIGGRVKQAWSSLKTYTWQTQASDTSTISILFEVKDSKGLKTTKSISIRIINPTVQQILQKVADNYALINDKKMDITITSKFNTENFGSTIYTRHFYKKPDKQRTETFSTADRLEANKTEIQISLGPATYLIDPKTKIKISNNIITELGLTQAQLNQMDEVYHLADFINAHTIIRNDNPIDLAKGLVNFEITPKVNLNFYSKLGMQIDYFKGIKTKSQTYIKENNLDKLKESIEISTSSKLFNGSWLPTKQIKTLYFDEGNLIMTFTITNIQVNTGLSDYLFDSNR